MREMKNSGIEWIGEIPKEWKITEIKHYCIDVFAGGTPQSTNFYYWGGDIKWIPSGSCHDCKIYSAPKTITKMGYENSSTKLIPANTALVAMTGATCGNTGFLTFESCANQSVTAYVANTKIADSLFLWYLLQSAKEHLLTFQTGGAQGGINVENCKNIVVPFVPISDQQKLSAYLDNKCTKIDSIIEKQEKIIEKLKAYKLSVITEAVTKGLNPDVKMKDSGVEWIGEIPEHWKCVPIKAYTDILPGYAFSSQDFSTEKGIPMLRGVNVTPKGIRWDETVYWNKELSDNLKTFVLHKGDVVMGLDRPWVSEGTRITFIEQDNLLLVQRVCKISTNKNMDKRWVYHWLDGEAFKQSVSIETTGVSVPHISTKQIGNFIISYPPLEEQYQIADYLDKKCSAIDKSIEQKQAIIEKLKEYKKSLIYEVVTGKREV